MAPSFRQLRTWGFVIAGWSVPALATTTRAYFGSRDERLVPTLLQVLALETPSWLLWIAVTPLVFGLVHWFPLERRRWLPALAAHITTASAVLLTSSVLVVTTIISFEGPEGAARIPVLEGVVLVAAQKLLPVVAIYAALTASAQAMLLNERLHGRRLQQARLQADLRGAELRALKMQLRPHFLFNALQSVSTLVESDPDAARQTLARLGDLLRTTLRNGGREMVSVDEELRFVERYLEIESTRFSDRLTVDLKVDNEARTGTVPGFLLQPLVENALHHGVAMRIEPSRVEIDVARVGNALRIRIQDDGPGFVSEFREGFGLSITRERLASLYGDAASVLLSNADTGGAVATLLLPLTPIEAVV